MSATEVKEEPVPLTEPYTDVVELCALLQCLGFAVKSLDTTSGSQEGAVRTVTINCQASGLHVVMESNTVSCSCPAASQQQNTGFWQVSGVTGGKHFDKESGSALLGFLPKAYREHLSKELLEIVRCIKENNESDLEKPKERESLSNKSTSMIDIKTPEKGMFQLSTGTPTRYRSLDTLTASKELSGIINQNLPAPGPLLKHNVTNDKSIEVNEQDNKKLVYQRQSTYTLSSTPDSIRHRNKTSSPIQGPGHKILESVRAAEKIAEDLRNTLAGILDEYRTADADEMNDSSMNSLVLDVSKISVLKGAEASKAQFASSPNLSALGNYGDDTSRPGLKRTESISTSNLATKQASKDGKITSKLRRISPNIFKFKKDGQSVYKVEKEMIRETKSSKLNTLFKPKTTTPARVSKVSLEPSPNLSSSRKKFSHVKSTIPRPSVKKE